MKNLLKLFCVLAAGLLSLPGQALAATLTVAPTIVSNTYSGFITLTAAGLNAGETVVIQKFADGNTNGLIDATDFLIQQFSLTDGAATVIGGVTNINVPGDTDTMSGQITARLNFQNGDFVQNFVGNYLYKLSRSTGPVATNLFTVTNSSFGQAFTGSVTNSGTNVPFPSVILFDPSSSGNLNPVAGCIANTNGVYFIKAPAGTYLLVAFKTNFVANTAVPNVTLNSGVTNTLNLGLIVANQSLSGKFVDAANASIGLPGLFIHAESTNGLIGIGSTDTNGNFTVRVTTNSWKISADSAALSSHGYLKPQSSTKTNTFGGSVAGITFSLPKATALFYGSVKTDLGVVMAGVHLYDSDNAGQYEGDPRTDVNGNYVDGVLAGTWSVSIDNQNPNFTNYVFSQDLGQTNLNNGTVVLQNFVAKLATNHITGYLRDNNSNPITNVNMNATANISGTNFQALGTVTDGSGNYFLNVANGNWDVSVSCFGGNNSLGTNYSCPNNQTTNVANNNRVVNFIVQQCAGVQITTTNLPGGQAGAYYDVFLGAASCFNSFTWTLNSGSLPSGLSLNSSGEIFGTPTSAGTNNFTVRVTDGNNNSNSQPLTLVIIPNATPPPPVYIAPANSQFAVFYPTSGTNYILETTTNVASGVWTPVTNSAPIIGVIVSNSAPAAFYRLH